MCMCMPTSPRGWALVESIMALYSETRFSYLMYPDRLSTLGTDSYMVHVVRVAAVSTGRFPYWLAFPAFAARALARSGPEEKSKKNSMKSSVHPSSTPPRGP